MPSFGKFRNELVFTHSLAFSPIYDVHRSKNEAVLFASEKKYNFQVLNIAGIRQKFKVCLALIH